MPQVEITADEDELVPSPGNRFIASVFDALSPLPSRGTKLPSCCSFLHLRHPCAFFLVLPKFGFHLQLLVCIL